MDVRCEKCQTEYELDEARLKPGGVTVKCTNCGHMFKIRKRTPTNVGAPPAGEQRPRTSSSKPPVPAGPRANSPNMSGPSMGGPMPRADSVLDEAPTKHLPDDGPTTVDRQWLIRLENGENKSCRELAMLQQWIVAGVVSRESLISRTGKTWKRLGDIAELAQYFEIADEARTTRDARKAAPTSKVGGKATMLGHAMSAAGGTILPDDDDERRTTGNYRNHPGLPPARRPITTPPPPPKKQPTGPAPLAPAPASAPVPVSTPMTTGPTQPAPIAAASAPMPPVMPATAAPTPAPPARGPSVPPPQDGRATAMWASDPVKVEGVAQTGPFGGKLAAIPDEPAFAGRVRMPPADESGFETGKVRYTDEDDDLLPRRSGSRMGMWILLMVLIIGGATATIVYLLVIKGDKDKDDLAAKAPKDAAVAQVTPDAAPIITPVIDAPPAPAKTPAELARAELAKDDEQKLRDTLGTLGTADDAPTQAIKALLDAAIAQSLFDRANLVADKAESAKLKKEQNAILIDAATLAQKALRAATDDAAANLAMAEILRLQGKPAAAFKRYIDVAKAKAADPTVNLVRDVALSEALTLQRDGKLDEAKAALGLIDSNDGALEKSGDVRARLHLAVIALAQNRAPDAKVLVDQVLLAQPNHASAKALSLKLETLVAKTDPLPPEDGKGSGSGSQAGTGSAKPPGPGPGPGPDVDVSPGDSYDKILAKANKIADTSCARAIDLFQKALVIKPNGVEALTGLGYCFVNAKQFKNAYDKFHLALVISPRYEPALAGMGEMYMQQGLRDRAIEAWKAYQDVYPNAKAKKQLEALGVSDTPPPTPGSNTPPPTPPTPTPATPGSDAPGAGSN